MTIRPISQVLRQPAAPSDRALWHFSARLEFETDPSDVYHDLTHCPSELLVVDARSPAAWAERRVPGALSLPHARITRDSVAPLWGRGLIVVYCWSSACNGATRAAATLAALGLPVKEMLGGLDAWVREGYPVEGTPVADESFDDYLRRHHRLPSG
jgi:rhodanese-related sulfurtransferase